MNMKENKINGLIYKITNLINNKIYIGQTIRPLSERIDDYKRGKTNNYLKNAFSKYGWDNFEFSIIDTAETTQELNLKEINYILKNKSNNKKYGYNIEAGGKNSIPNIETLKKMSQSHSGKKQSFIWIEKRIAKAGSDEAKKYGRKKTEEEKEYLRKNSPKYWSGKTRNEETRRKISETKIKNNLSNKQKESCFKTVYKKDPITYRTLETFDSTKQASERIGVNQSTISRWCMNKKINKGFLWTY